VLLGCGEVEAPGYTPSTGAAASSTVGREHDRGEHERREHHRRCTGEQRPATRTTARTAPSTGDAAARAAPTRAPAADAGSAATAHLDPGEECDDGFAENAPDAACLHRPVSWRRAAMATSIPASRSATTRTWTSPTAATSTAAGPAGSSSPRRPTRATSSRACGGPTSAAARSRPRPACPTSLGYMAWLSDSTTSPARAHAPRQGPLRARQRPARRRELGRPGRGRAREPDLRDGEERDPRHHGVDRHQPRRHRRRGSNHCLDWTSNDNAATEFWGVSTEITADWTLADVDLNPMNCGAQIALYCFEQE
jgi:hypothetical protein